MKRAQIGLLKKQILEVLASTTEARNSDQYLTLCIWNRYYPQYVQEVNREVPGKEPEKVRMVSLRDIMILPREDNVKRIRAIIQNVEKRYLPTSAAVRKQRKINQEVWEEYSRNSNNL